ncbi:MAG: hypothetical protein NTY14_06905 [Candidatus Omnitrophica bacterium]|nr:hypothetical protein [Candidatus Omnitrophota bacterium]
MKNRRQFWKIETTIIFLNVALIIATTLTIVSFFALIKIITAPQDSLMWRINLVILQLCFAGVIFTFVLSIFWLVQRGLGPLTRIEQVLDKVLEGDYKVRLGVREKDLLYTFINKVNRVIELLEKKGNK